MLFGTFHLKFCSVTVNRGLFNSTGRSDLFPYTLSRLHSSYMYKVRFRTDRGFSVRDKVSARHLYHNAKLQVERYIRPNL